MGKSHLFCNVWIAYRIYPFLLPSFFLTFIFWFCTTLIRWHTLKNLYALWIVHHKVYSMIIRTNLCFTFLIYFLFFLLFACPSCSSKFLIFHVEYDAILSHFDTQYELKSRTVQVFKTTLNTNRTLFEYPNKSRF